MHSKAMQKYLERYAEADLVTTDKTWSLALVVPALDEADTLPHLLTSLQALTGSASILLIVVINARVGTKLRILEANQHLLSFLRHGESMQERMVFTEHDGVTVLSVDASSPGRLFAPKEGVGLARKVGCDLATRLYASGHVESEFCISTDADARLPTDLHAQIQQLSKGDVGGVLPFTHTLGDGDTGEALALYECWLRYYTQGLHWAKSPYAFPTIGSLIVFSLEHYTAVRGFPKRQAGEDFYFLNKLAKLGPIKLLCGAPVQLAERLSERVPFGTGPATKRYLDMKEAGEPILFYAPMCFAALSEVLQSVETFIEHRRWSLPESLPALECMEHFNLVESLEECAKRTTRRSTLAQAAHTWLDGFRTLKMVHYLRDTHYPSILWTRALAEAPWGVNAGVGEGRTCPKNSLRSLRLTDTQRRATELKRSQIL